MKRLLFFSALAFAALALSACSSAPPPAEFTVEMTEFAFTPNEFEVQVGQEVTFHLANHGALEHEFMIGRSPMMMDSMPGGYEHNMFEHDEPMVMGGEAHHEMGGMDHGFMVAIPRGGDDATITFTVTEDMIGEWEIGCFTDGGSHYDQGMHGTLIVNP
ncbi:MAG TPA: cupredoxin domain-containing protein [Anaerolineales bacterium]|nr:cupredoxin domain-containing protein [Anaerolineales bacterium]